jgi:hypothetical protein
VGGNDAHGNSGVPDVGCGGERGAGVLVVGRVERAMMFLIDSKGAHPICRECRRLHAAKDCPKRESVNWREIERAADEFCSRLDAYWGRRSQLA